MCIYLLTICQSLIKTLKYNKEHFTNLSTKVTSQTNLYWMWTWFRSRTGISSPESSSLIHWVKEVNPSAFRSSGYSSGIPLCSQFHKHFTISFLPISLLTKKYKYKLKVQKTAKNTYVGKILLLKCRWHWHHGSISSTYLRPTLMLTNAQLPFYQHINAQLYSILSA